MKMFRQVLDGIIQIRASMVSCYLIIEAGEACLIDTGFVGHLELIKVALKSKGLDWKHLKWILLTHGHLDHTYNAQVIKERSGALIYGHPDDELHFQCRYPYQGITRICGLMEWAGRMVYGFRPFAIDHALQDEQVIGCPAPVRVVHLPGHTRGHCGFYDLKRSLLFSGDMVANCQARVMLPLPWFNSCPEDFPESVQKVIDLNPEIMLANHCDKSGPQDQRDRFMKKFRREAIRKQIVGGKPRDIF